MSGIASLSSVAYKKGSWMRYTLWGLAVICIAVLMTTFFGMLNGEISAAVPDGYKFSVTNNYSDKSRVRTTYYVYDNRIFVEDESFEKDSVNRIVLVYEGVNTDSLVLDPNDTIEICELGTCYQVPKVLAVIKKLVSKKTGREYIGI